MIFTLAADIPEHFGKSHAPQSCCLTFASWSKCRGDISWRSDLFNGKRVVIAFSVADSETVVPFCIKV